MSTRKPHKKFKCGADVGTQFNCPCCMKWNDSFEKVQKHKEKDFAEKEMKKELDNHKSFDKIDKMKSLAKNKYPPSKYEYDLWKSFGKNKVYRVSLLDYSYEHNFSSAVILVYPDGTYDFLWSDAEEPEDKTWGRSVQYVFDVAYKLGQESKGEK